MTYSLSRAYVFFFFFLPPPSKGHSKEEKRENATIIAHGMRWVNYGTEDLGKLLHMAKTNPTSGIRLHKPFEEIELEGATIVYFTEKRVGHPPPANIEGSHVGMHTLVDIYVRNLRNIVIDIGVFHNSFTTPLAKGVLAVPTGIFNMLESIDKRLNKDPSLVIIARHPIRDDIFIGFDMSRTGCRIDLSNVVLVSDGGMVLLEPTSRSVRCYLRCGRSHILEMANFIRSSAMNPVDIFLVCDMISTRTNIRSEIVISAVGTAVDHGFTITFFSYGSSVPVVSQLTVHSSYDKKEQCTIIRSPPYVICDLRRDALQAASDRSDGKNKHVFKVVSNPIKPLPGHTYSMVGLIRVIGQQMVKTSIPRVCRACEKTAVSHKCGRCVNVYYCSRKCQKKHWKDTHRAECRLFTDLEEKNESGKEEKSDSGKEEKNESGKEEKSDCGK